MVEIRPFDPQAATPADWGAVHAFRRARNGEDTPGEPVPDDAEFERQLRQSWPLYEDRRWYAWAGDEIAGLLGASFRRDGTADHAAHAPYVDAWCGVRRHRRRRGVATALLRPLLDLMRERNKTVATLNTSTAEGEAFLAAVGAVPKHSQIENRAPFARLDWPMLARWRGDAVPDGAPLRWEIHPTRVPRDRMESLIPQFDALLADLPSGGLDTPPPRSELPGWLSWYGELDRYGGDHALVLLTAGDAVAALCETTWDSRFPDRVFQMLTAVARPWRGRGLGKGVKAAMLELVRERHPEVRFVTTTNADVNAPMLSINARLGFAEHRRTVSYQVGPDAIAVHLALRAGRG